MAGNDYALLDSKHRNMVRKLNSLAEDLTLPQREQLYRAAYFFYLTGFADCHDVVEGEHEIHDAMIRYLNKKYRQET